MISLSEYYEESLYPLQDGVLQAVSGYGTRFFLTGGTALSRGYYNHRYSDDLDFFVTSDSDYEQQVNTVFSKLPEDGFFIDTESGIIKNAMFTSFKVRWNKTGAALKLDFVNDTAPHFGGVQKTPIFDRTDSIRNMLSNKLSALFRFAGKDVADIREIALRENIDWTGIIIEAREKELGLEIPIICEILSTMPKKEFDEVHWTRKPEWELFCADIDALVRRLAVCE
jgi:predicted nucleotidyltransferase component of viral defense system